MKSKKVFLRITAFAVALIVLASSVFVITRTVYATRKSVRSVKAAISSSARAMCTIEAESGRVLYEKNADAKLPMASTTKIMTAITVLENCPDIDIPVQVNPKAVGIEGTSIYLKSGETLTVRELLYGLMLRSGNDAAAALALHVCPPKENVPKNEIFNDFCQKMQETAIKAGAKNSSFKNPHGLDQDGHYTTALDLALISAYSMKNPDFAEIVKTEQIKISGADYPRILSNKNRLLKSMDSCVGIKTGFTKKAGRCFVGASAQNGMTVISVVLNCGPMFEEAAVLMEQAQKDYMMKRILTKDEFIGCADGERCGIALENFFYPLCEGEQAEVKCEDDKVCVYFENNLIYCAEYIKLYNAH